MLAEYMAECPYCGQMVAVSAEGGISFDEQREAAGRKCTCTGANRARMLRDSIDRIDMVCGGASIDNGFDYPLPDDEIALLRRLAEDVIDGRISRAVLRMVSGDEVRLLDAISYVKVKRTHKKQLEM